MGVKGLSQCQQRWWRHISPQRELEIQTSTEDTAPDIPMCLCLLTDGTKPDLTRGQRLAKRETDRRWRGRRKNKRGVCDYRKLLGHLEAAHAIKQDVRETRI